MTNEKFFELTRAQIEHEDRLINNRVTWLLSLQAFLFGAYGFTVSAQATLLAQKVDVSALDFVDHARRGLAIMSFFASVVLLTGVAAAAGSMAQLVSRWDDRLRKAGNVDSDYPQVIGRAVSGLGIYGGLAPTYALPVLAALVWVFLEPNWVTGAAAATTFSIAVFSAFYTLGYRRGARK